MAKPLFLDRDGVINQKAPAHEYITKVEDFIFLPGAIDALRTLQEAGWEFYIVTNQAGIARGKMSLDDLSAIHEHMRRELKDRGVEIKHIYYCPHGYDDGCDCRKPKPGMLLQAAQEHGVNLSEAFYVGDEERDEQAARAVGTAFIKVSSKIGIAEALPVLLSKSK